MEDLVTLFEEEGPKDGEVGGGGSRQIDDRERDGGEEERERQGEEGGSSRNVGGGDAEDEGWWDGVVAFEGRCVTREKALRLMQCETAAERRSEVGGGEAGDEDGGKGEGRFVSMHGRLVPLGWEKRLLLLRPAVN